MSNDDRVGRRSFLRGGSGLALGLLGGAMAQAQEIKPKGKAKAPAKAVEKPPAPVTCAVIGLGDQGRDILKALAMLPGATAERKLALSSISIEAPAATGAGVPSAPSCRATGPSWRMPRVSSSSISPTGRIGSPRSRRPWRTDTARPVPSWNVCTRM